MSKPLPKCDCLNWCGDDPCLAKGKAEYCDHYKKQAKESALIEVIAWKLPADEMPDDDIVVLGFFGEDDQSEPVWPCLHVGESWLIADGYPTPPPKAWADMPGGPVNTPWMTVRGKS